LPSGFTTDEKTTFVSVRDLSQRFKTDSAESPSQSLFAPRLSNLRNPTTRGLFGQRISYREIEYAVKREPAAFRIVFGVAKDVFDNWFKVVLKTKNGETDNGELDAFAQKKLRELGAKQKLRKLLTLDRAFGYAVLVVGFDDGAATLSEPVSNGQKDILYIEPYSRLEISSIDEEKDPGNPRMGYPYMYHFNTKSDMGGDRRVHYSRVIHCATLLIDHRYEGYSQLDAYMTIYWLDAMHVGACTRQ
jgi:hypothetical protein